MSDTPVTYWDSVRAFFVKDKDQFWFRHYSSDEVAFDRMNAWQLAAVIQEADARNTVDWVTKKIVAEHLLAARLAKLQARPNWWAMVIAVCGVIGGAFLTTALQKPQEQSKCVCEYQSASTANNSVQALEKSLVIVAPSKSVISVPANVKEGAAVQNNGKPAEKN